MGQFELRLVTDAVEKGVARFQFAAACGPRFKPWKADPRLPIMRRHALTAERTMTRQMPDTREAYRIV
jgi:hypothetical protein